MFVIARHMVVKTTTSFEDLLSVLSVAVLLLIRKYAGGPLFASKRVKDQVREEKSEYDMQKIRQKLTTGFDRFRLLILYIFLVRGTESAQADKMNEKPEKSDI